MESCIIRKTRTFGIKPCWCGVLRHKMSTVDFCSSCKNTDSDFADPFISLNSDFATHNDLFIFSQETNQPSNNSSVRIHTLTLVRIPHFHTCEIMPETCQSMVPNSTNDSPVDLNGGRTFSYPGG